MSLSAFLLLVMPYLLIFLYLGLWIFGVVFVINGINELFFDLIKLGRDVWRKFYVFRFKGFKPLSEDDLLGKPEQAVAIMIPCWDESAVISRMLENSIKVLNYSNYVIFVGTYPNDPATQREVDIIRGQYNNVERIVCPKDGPTSKADCLNWIYEGIKHYEKEHGMAFEVVVMEDSEDVLHPLTLRLFNYMIPRMDMVQIPVFPMEPHWWQFTRGTYLDEFAENHSRDMIVREILSSNLPSAGVGTAFSRNLLIRLTKANQGRLFTIGSVTEDYDFGIRLAMEKDVKQIFARVRFVRTRRIKSRLTGREKDVQISDFIGVREFFPSSFKPAVRQKSRWVLGITLQAWQTIGWVGGFWTRYMLVRDRMGLFTNQVNMLANLLVPIYLAAWGYIFFYPETYRFPAIVHRGTPLYYLLLTNLCLLCWQLTIRAYYVYSIYGPWQAALSPFRLVWANVINYFATVRALRLFITHLITGAPVAWDKTDHAYPTESELVRFRRRLGDLLLDRRFITVNQLDDALEKQKQSGLPLGRVLVDMGYIGDEDLLQILGFQFSLQTTDVDPYAVDLETLALISEDLAVKYQIFPLEVLSSGAIAAAVDQLPVQDDIRKLEQELGRPLELRLTTRGELAFAVRRGYARLHGPAGGESLGRKLVEKGLITAEQLDDALRRQRRAYRNLGDILASMSLLDQSGLEKVSELMEDGGDKPLGERLVERGVISREDLEAALEKQRNRTPRLGDVLVEMGAIDRRSLEQAVEEGN